MPTPDKLFTDPEIEATLVPYEDLIGWRGVRNALEATDPAWKALSNEAREPKWKFASALINIFWRQMYRRCAGCQQERSPYDFYRCWDCKGWLCEGCVKSHFGPQHQPHPKLLRQFEVEAEQQRDELAAARETTARLTRERDESDAVIATADIAGCFDEKPWIDPASRKQAVERHRASREGGKT